MKFETILEFWFGEQPDADIDPARLAQWFKPDQALDEIIRGRFLPFLVAAGRNELHDWLVSARGRLALVILLDQVPRHVFRGSANAFLYDAQALSIAREGVAMGLDRYQAIEERLFFYMPFQHAEDPAAQHEGLTLYRQLQQDARGTPASDLAGQALESAEDHEKLIRRFGRFPHRNEALGRLSTDLEMAYLQSGAARRYGQ